ncbi:carboxypeptidase-like regulatory domain-containing protein [Roseivirga sp. E12]|uniref:carboxypeptidase-like regulatory domain-containing protein n=1 Tax=Roseivirga sp. E12 TaxID=2819237 RepID=UPI001ABC29D6|nr:carboxypeptidase-like regulatory domain-containing protein [Roseivirga sp. E12]MBO3699628.1 carboxypeptidase-like regulatory domain-containing protein [Roseivirga sp. E12]
MKRLLTICTLLLLTGTAYAQNQPDFFLKGQLLDSATKRPMAFASVLVLNKNKGIASNPAGNFEIPVNLGDSIKISSVGYADYTFVVTSEMRKQGYMKIIEMTEEALALDDFRIYQMSDNFYLRRKVLDTLDPPVKGVNVLGMPLYGPPSKFVPQESGDVTLLSIPIFQEISKNPKQARIIRKMEEASDFQAQRKREREKYFNKDLVKRVTRIDDRVIDEFMEFCNFLDGEILGRSEFDITKKILIRYQAFLRR